MNDSEDFVLRGKPLGDVSWFHEDFLDREDEYLNRQRAVEAVYTAGDERQGCIICGMPLAGPIGYSRGAVHYSVCSNCGHVNGMNIISDRFNEFAYGDCADLSESVESRPYECEFTSGKKQEEFDEVVARIYSPKAAFLTDVLARRLSGKPSDLKVLDFGCGSGHFVEALRLAGFASVKGVDSLPDAVAEAGRHGLQDHVSLVPVTEVKSQLADSGADVISMMCVLPHLQDPLRALEAMRAGGVRWTFQKLPMWSFATLLEAAFPDLRSRVLAMDHTHAFTWQSLNWIENNLGLRRVGYWSFGSDALDLSRKLMQRMRSVGTSAFSEWALASLDPCLEGVQAALDEGGMSSEIHLVWEFTESTH